MAKNNRGNVTYYISEDLAKKFSNLCEKKRMIPSRILEDLLLDWIEKNKEGDNAA